jgi:hypothetical protein
MLAARPAHKYRPKAGQRLALMRSQRVERLEYQGYVVPLHPMIGHNLGPGLFDWDAQARRQMKEAHAAAWTPPTPDIGKRRVEKAHALGLTYEEYALEILERGHYPQRQNQNDD